MEGDNMISMNASKTPTNFSYFACLTVPARINSNGLFAQIYTEEHEQVPLKYTWLDYSAPRLELLIFFIFAATQICHFVLKRLGLPQFVSQIVAGLLLSPSISILPDVISAYVIQENSTELLGAFGSFGYAFFLFLSGVKVDINMAMRAGRKAISLGVLSVLLPLFFSIGTSFILYKDPKERDRCIYLASQFIITSFPVINGLLTDLKIPNSELGRLGLSSAVIADLVGYVLILIRIFTKVAKSHSTNKVAVYYELGYIALFVIGVAFIYRPLMMLIVRFTPEGGSVKTVYVYATLLPFLFCMKIPFLLSDFLIMMMVYALGLAVPPGPPLGSALVNKFEGLVSSFFVPLFVTACAMRVEYIQFRIFEYDMQKITIVVVGTLLVKFCSCLLPLIHNRMPKNDVIALAIIFCCKGIVELGDVTYASDTKIISQDLFSFMVIIITLVASFVPILVRKLYDPSRKFAGYQKRKVTDCKPNSELQMIACIHVPKNVNSVINFLDVSHPTRENPIALSVLHLIKLHGQANPIFLSHQKGTKNFNGYCYSENVIVSFKNFEATNWGAASVDVFTAISRPNLMDDDICTLALDKLSSFIILPFHRTWYIDGSLESDDPNIRILNYSVLEKAPCSVGILIDHNNIKRPATRAASMSRFSCNIAVLFIGGFDDREALALAKRMARDPRVYLTVAHFIAKADDGMVNWQTILDSEALKDCKSGNNDYIKYVKHEVNDGPDTVNIVRTMVDDHSLMIVGRRYNHESRQTFGLKEWIEFPELGILGDILASKDMGGKCSVLIVQQQQSLQGC